MGSRPIVGTTSNPAHQILHNYGVEPGAGFEQEIPDERLKAMVADFRGVPGRVAS